MACISANTDARLWVEIFPHPQGSSPAQSAAEQASSNRNRFDYQLMTLGATAQPKVKKEKKGPIVHCADLHDQVADAPVLAVIETYWTALGTELLQGASGGRYAVVQRP